VSLTGITGSKLTDLAEVRANVEKIRKISAIPVVVGFGVATPEDAAKVAGIADGVIVGSAIVKHIGAHQQTSGMVAEVGSFVKSLKAAMASSSTAAGR
jgi:tryptophan synthase alpha chain